MQVESATQRGVSPHFYEAKKEIGTEPCFHGFKVSLSSAVKPVFSFGRVLGQGAYGIVYQATCPNGCEVAIKQIKRDSLLFEYCAESEIETLRHIRKYPQKNIVSFFGCYDRGDSRYLVFEKGDHDLGSLLLAHRMSLTVEDFNAIAYQLFQAVVQLHELKIEYLDFKFENVVFFGDERLFKLIDFERASLLPKEQSRKTTNILQRFSFELINLQLRIRYKNDKAMFFENNKVLAKSAYSYSCDLLMPKLLDNSDIWDSSVSPETRHFLIQCFSSDQRVLEGLFLEKDIFYPRSDLTLFTKPLTQELDRDQPLRA